MVSVSVLAGMAVASLNGLATSQQNAAATRIRTVMIYAQEWAMGTNNDTWVKFDASADAVSAFVEDPGNPGTAGRLTLTDPLTRSALVLQLGGDAAGLETVDIAGTGELQFNSLGTPLDASGAVLSSDGTVTVTGGVTVRVTKNTGLVTID